MKYAMIVDVNKCSLCYSCVVACKDEFVGNPYPPHSYPQHDKNCNWIRLLETEKGQYPYAKVYPIPILCMHCEEAPCISACPVSNCIYRTEKGIVIIDPAKCNGCKSCIKVCPYEVISFNEDNSICQKCTLCIHRLSEGKEPACVDACPSNVFTFGEESKIIREAKGKKAKRLYPEHGTKGRIFYMGLPSPTIAGHLIDAASLMDVPDATITVKANKTGLPVICNSNLAGNFLCDELKIKTAYSINIECKGYLPKTLPDTHTKTEYVHLGDVKLFKKETKKRK